MIRALNRLIYNLNNGFHLQEKKFQVKNNTFSSGLKNLFPLAGIKNSLKNILDNGRKWFPLARKWVSIRKSKISTSRKEFSSKVDSFH